MTVNTNGESFDFNIPHLDFGKLDNVPENPSMVCGFTWAGCFSTSHKCMRASHDTSTRHVCGICRKAYIRETIQQIVTEVNYIDP